MVEIQSILIKRKDKNGQPITLQRAKNKVKKLNGKIKKVDITTNYYRFRQQNPDLFIQTSFRIKTLSNCTKIVVGKKK